MIDALRRIAVVVAAVLLLCLVAALIWVIVGWILAVIVAVAIVVLAIALFNGPVRFDGRTGRFVSRSGRSESGRWES